MKTSPFLDYLLGDIFENYSLNVSVRSMMGGYILYNEGKVFGLAENDDLWLKGKNEVADWYLSRGSKKFSYIKNSKIQEMNFFLVPNEIVENRESLGEWLDIALSVAEIPKKKNK